MKKQDTKTKQQNDGQLVALQEEIEQWKTKYVRALADYQNLEKRTATERQEERKFVSSILLERLLPVIDTLERAQVHLQDQGLGLALKEFYAFLQEQGVKKMDVVGKPFNPHEMECIEVVDGEQNQVVEEVFPGYRLHDRVLRIAQVKVGKQMEKSN